MIRASDFALFLLVALVILSLMGCATGRHHVTECDRSKAWVFPKFPTLTREEQQQIDYYTKYVCTGEVIYGE